MFQENSARPWRSVVLAAACLAALVAHVVGATPGSSVPLNKPFLVTQLPVDRGAESRATPAGGMLRTSYGDGARIVLVNRDGTTRVLTAGFRSACDPEVSFDATRMLFAGKRSATDTWNIYELAIDSSAVRQITHDLGDCRTPGYQSTYYEITEESPWQQITFVRIDPRVRNECGAGPVSSIYCCKPDGTGARRLTYNLSSDYDPYIMWDGRLLYASWQRAGFEHGREGRIRILGVNTEGADCAAFVPDQGRRIQHMPCTTGPLAVFVETDRVPWDGAGQLSCVQWRRPLHTYQPLTAAADGLFHSPSPLPDGTLLVSWRPADASGTHAVYRLDPASKHRELVFDDPQWHDIQAKAVAAREVPDGRSSSMNVSDLLGKLYCLDVYTSDLKEPHWLPPGKAKRVRVIEGIPCRTGPPDGGSGAGAGRHIPQLAPRRILGEIPIQDEYEGDVRDDYAKEAEDENQAKRVVTGGSFNVEVPANTPIQLQLLDDNGVALRSCGWIWVRNHQAQGCIGCHEDGELTPTNWQVAALWRDSVKACPPPEQRLAIGFRRDVFPILANRCTACHDKKGRPPTLTNDPGTPDTCDAEAKARFAYEALLGPDKAGTPVNPYGKYVHPGRARTSPLIWHLFGRNLARPWDGATANQSAKPIPPDRAPPLTAKERELLVKWVDLGALWEQSPGAAAASTGQGSREEVRR